MLEIEAVIPSGAPDSVIRTVTENRRTLKFTSQGFKKRVEARIFGLGTPTAARRLQMLTREAISERKWGPYPKLRQVFQDKKMPDGFYGVTSVSDSMLEGMRRLIEIATLVDKHRADIKNAMPTLGRDELRKDLYHIQDELDRTSRLLCAMRDSVRSVLDDLR
jgi:hypothetical protein